jgi:DNA-binding response OmpR family regulator
MPDKQRVLIVDDEMAVADMLAICCEFWGFEPIVANTGEQALKLIAERDPDVIVTDFMMPGMTGHELCRRARNNGSRDIPMIMISAAPEAAKRGCTADVLIPKPLDLDHVERTMRELLERRAIPNH